MDKIPPHNIDAEYSVLGRAVYNQDTLDKVIEYGENIYYDNNNRILWKVLSSLYSMDIQPDITIIKQVMKDEHGVVDDTYLVSILKSSCLDADGILRELKEKWKRREIIRLTQILKEKAHTREDIDGEILELVELGEANTDKINVFDIADYNKQTLEELKINHEYIKAGIDGLDARIEGFEPGQFIIVAAESGEGKTTLTWQIATNIENSLFITLEEVKRNLYFKLLSRLSGVNSAKFKTMTFFDDELSRIDEAKKHIDDKVQCKVVDDDLNLIQIIGLIRREHKKHVFKIVIVENLGLISGGIGDNESSRRNYITRQFKKLAKELKVPIIMNSQQTKGSYNREPTMADLEYVSPSDPDIILFCYNQSIVMAKGRNCEIGTISNILFEKEYSRFKTLSPGSLISDNF